MIYRFQTMLTRGGKPPYASWTFLIVPADLAKRWGPGRKSVRGTISGHAFRGTAAKGEGFVRVPIPQALREKAGVRDGDTIDVTLELDTAPRRVLVPEELRAIFAKDAKVADLYKKLPPSLQRAWAAYIADAKRPETRLKRARKAPAGIRAREFPK